MKLTVGILVFLLVGLSAVATLLFIGWSLYEYLQGNGDRAMRAMMCAFLSVGIMAVSGYLIRP